MIQKAIRKRKKNESDDPINDGERKKKLAIVILSCNNNIWNILFTILKIVIKKKNSKESLKELQQSIKQTNKQKNV